MSEQARVEKKWQDPHDLGSLSKLSEQELAQLGHPGDSNETCAVIELIRRGRASNAREAVQIINTALGADGRPEEWGERTDYEYLDHVNQLVEHGWKFSEALGAANMTVMARSLFEGQKWMRQRREDDMLETIKMSPLKLMDRVQKLYRDNGEEFSPELREVVEEMKREEPERLRRKTLTDLAWVNRCLRELMKGREKNPDGYGLWPGLCAARDSIDALNDFGVKEEEVERGLDHAVVEAVRGQKVAFAQLLSKYTKDNFTSRGELWRAIANHQSEIEALQKKLRSSLGAADTEK